MNLEKITAGIEGKEYVFTVETIPSDEPAVIYRVVPDNDEKLLNDIINGYIDFDAKGNVQTDIAEENMGIGRGIIFAVQTQKSSV